MSHPDIDAETQERLRATLGEPADTSAEPTPPSPRAGPPSDERAGRMKTSAKRALRPVVDRLSDRVAARLHDPVARRIVVDTHARVEELDARLELLRGEVRSIVPALQALRSVTDTGAMVAAGRDLADELHRLQVNLELNKGELAAVRRTIEDFGRAVAPAAGLAGAPARFAELRERVNAIDRRTRAGVVPGPEGSTSPTPSSPPTPGFDYVGFEHRFRGERGAIANTLCDRYLDLLVDHAPVLDVGCGRGELLAALAEHGVEGEGVDLDVHMAEEARAAGVGATSGDVLEFLASRPDRSFGAITAIHVVEHLALDQLVAFLELAAAKLEPGGVLVAETPNPMSLVVLGNSYVLDPTHVWPIHPSLLTFLCERAGFRDVELRFYAPAEDYRMATVDDPDAPPWVETVNRAIEHLNDVLFGPQEYGAIAVTPNG